MDTRNQYPNGDLPKGYTSGTMPDMKPHERRRINLQAVIDKEFGGNKGQFADFVGKKRPQIYRIFSDSPISRRDIGEDLAREFEGLLNLPIYALDKDGEPEQESTPAAAETVEKYIANRKTPALLLLIKDIETAFNNKSLTQDAINSLRTLITSLKPPTDDISTCSESDKESLDLQAKWQSKTINLPEKESRPDKNGELDAD